MTYRIASRSAFAHLRKEKRRRQHETNDEIVDAVAVPVGRPSGDQLRELLDSAIVSPASRAVLMLHVQEEMPLADVAAVLELPLGTVKSRLAYGLAALRRHAADKAVGAFIWTAQANRAPAPENYGVLKLFIVAMIAQMLLMASCTVILMFHVTRMTRAVLRRIELAKRH